MAFSAAARPTSAALVDSGSSPYIATSSSLGSADNGSGLASSDFLRCTVAIRSATCEATATSAPASCTANSSACCLSAAGTVMPADSNSSIARCIVSNRCCSDAPSMHGVRSAVWGGRQIVGIINACSGCGPSASRSKAVARDSMRCPTDEGRIKCGHRAILVPVGPAPLYTESCVHKVFA